MLVRSVVSHRVTDLAHHPLDLRVRVAGLRVFDLVAGLEHFSVLLAPAKVPHVSLFLIVFQLAEVIVVILSQVDLAILEHCENEEVKLVLQIQHLFLDHGHLHVPGGDSLLYDVFLPLDPEL